MRTGSCRPFPDLQIALEDVMSEGDKTAVRYSFQATHLGDGLGVPVTNQKVHGTGIAITRWRDGRWIEGWNELDVMGLMQQIGAAAPTSARA